MCMSLALSLMAREEKRLDNRHDVVVATFDARRRRPVEVLDVVDGLENRASFGPTASSTGIRQGGTEVFHQIGA